jgi:transcriptional regulator with XRE-family HTH domain
MWEKLERSTFPQKSMPTAKFAAPVLFAERVRNFRRERGISASTLAAISRNALHLIENKAANAQLSTVERLSIALDVDPCDFFRPGKSTVSPYLRTRLLQQTVATNIARLREQSRMAGTNSQQGEFVKAVGLAVLMATFTPAAFAAGYKEVWNPPEARATAPHRVTDAHKLAAHRDVVPHTVKVHARRATPSAPKLVAKQSKMQKTVPAREPDMSEIPRQLTPEGNVLRVDAHDSYVKVAR